MSSLEAARSGLRAALERSAVVKFLREARALETEVAARARALTPAEIAGLEARGNTCENWEAVRLAGSGSLDAVRACRFEGSILLRFEQNAGAMGATLWNSRFRDAVIGAATVENVAMARRVRIGDGAFLSNLGEISGRKRSRFGLGAFLQPGSEVGARKVFLLDGLRVADCAAMSALHSEEQDLLAADFEAALAGLETDHAFVGPKSRLEHTPVIENCFLGPGTTIRAAALVRDAILASALDAPVTVGEAAHVSGSILDAGVGVHSAAQVHRSLLLEFSGAERGGQVSDSVLGPNSIMAKGEITASLVGPFTGFHHQSLLIGALWPEGRGNVGYGANVGSNHTGRKPDQELRAGEGVFFGLGCSIKFPANFEAAPYSLFASGVLAAPQKLAFPFSLVTTMHEPSAPGLNEILPGWMWSDNAYALVRNAYKYAERNRAKMHAVPEEAPAAGNPLEKTFLAADLFAPRIVQWVREGLAAFPSVAPVKTRTVYTEKEIAGLGKNFLRGTGLKKARAAYKNYLGFALVRLALWNPGVSIVHSEEGRPLLKLLGLANERELDVEALFEAFALSVEQSLAKDAARGERIFDDYAAFHPAPGADGVCHRLRADLRKLLVAWQVLVGT
jgi:hypothetical protein